MLQLYENFVNDYLALPVLTGEKSEKEKFVGAKYTKTLEGIMPDGKALQMGTSHHLGQNFSKPFEISFLGKDEKQHFAWQTSWGVSWRLIGALIMIHGDDKGLILPPRIAPIQVVIIPIYYNEEQKKDILKVSKEITEQFEKNNIRIIIDSNEQYTPGWKFNHWEMKGVPIRIEIGPKDLDKNSITVVKRNVKEKKQIKITNNLVNQINEELDNIQVQLFDTAKKKQREMIHEVNNYTDLCQKLKINKGFMKAFWCESVECEDKIKEETGADIRLLISDAFPYEKVVGVIDPEYGECISCSKKATKTVYFAKSY